MKKIYPNPGGWLIPALLLLPVLTAIAQEKPPPKPSWLASRQIAFIVHAPVLLPELYKGQQYETMHNFLTNWANSSYPSRELIFAADALLAIETGKFSAYSLPCDGLYYLQDYARELRLVAQQDPKFRYYLKLDYPYSYDATQQAKRILLFIQYWARELLARPYLDNDELYICRTLAGNVPDPQTTLRNDPQIAPRIARQQKDLADYNNAVFTSRRNGIRGTAGISIGWWSPTSRLRTLGSHPSVGLLLGRRNDKNEYDLNWNLRFGYPTPKTYTFLRYDTLYSTNYYDGGYIGFEDTRYLLHRKYLDVGVTSGIAYDYFSVADGWSYHSGGPDLIPLNVGSFDFNNGIRLKYFFKRKAYIGLTAKYHLIHYDNSGGTNLDGNAYTLDLSFGSH
jgi:hypothetical protein